MNLGERQNAVKTRVKEAIIESPLNSKKVAGNCKIKPEYFYKLLSIDSGKILNEEVVRNIADVINADFEILWYGEKQITESSVEYDSDYARTPLSVEQFIEKFVKTENLDQEDIAFLNSLYSRGSKLDKVPAKSMMNMLKAFRENAKAPRGEEGGKLSLPDQIQNPSDLDSGEAG